MNTETLLILFGALTVALTIVCIVLIASLKKNKNDDAIFEEFRRNREEMARSSKDSRQETTAALGKKKEKLYTITDMMKAFDFLAGLSNQKVSRLVTQLKEDNLVERIEDKRKTFFKKVK